MKLILLGGLSGAGKTGALDMLEDIGYHTVDNLPLSLIAPAVDEMLGESNRKHYSRLAIGLDPYSAPEEFQALAQRIEQWRTRKHGCTVVYLFCEADTLIKRYRATRRRHPMTDGNTDLVTAIAREAEALQPLAHLADIRIDTTHTNIHQLREIIRERVSQDHEHPMSLIVESFGYRLGLAHDADYIFDMRCLPNPYWDPSLREFTGLDQPVIEYLEGHNTVTRMLSNLVNFISDWLPSYASSNRSYLTVALGCTGGRHRSVYMAEQMAKQLAHTGWRVTVRHRDIQVSAREIKIAPSDG